MQKLTLVSVLGILCLFARAQQPVLKPLTIGDTLSDITIANVYNYPSSILKLSDFKGKLVILDFMATGCVSCVEALPRLDSIQKLFRGKVAIVLVSPEAPDIIQSFLKRKNMSGISLPAVANDTILSQLFPHTYISHEVFIKNGIVKAITWPEYVTAANIELISLHENISLPLKKDVTDFKFKEPLLFLNSNIIPSTGSPEVLGYGTITTHIQNLPERFTRNIDTAKNLLHVSMVNVPIAEMYSRTLYGTGLQPAFIRLPINDVARYVYKEGSGFYHDWLAKNTFCYDGWFSLHISDSLIKQKVKSDLNFYLGLDGRMEKQMASCWVIRKTNPTTIAKAKAYQAKNNKTGISIQSIVYGLNQTYGGIPVIDESGTPEINLYGLSHTQYKNIEIIKEHLREYGLTIVRADRLINLLVITELN